MGRCCTALFLIQATCATAQSGPIYHWLLDESDGTIAHGTFGTANGVLQNGAQWAPAGGHHQGACRFDGVNDMILTGPCDLTTGGGEIGFSLWVKPDFVTAMDRTLLIKAVGPAIQDHVWSLIFVNATAVRFNLRTASTTTTLSTPHSSIFSGTWYHLAASFDGTAMRIWINASLMAENSVTGSMGYHPEAPASFGATSTGTAAFSGWIDDVRIYDHGLSSDDVLNILLEDEVLTEVRTDPPWLGLDSRLHLPTGAWTELQLMDAAGRAVSAQHISGHNNVIELERLPAGLYLVCLQGEGRRAAWPMVIP